MADGRLIINTADKAVIKYPDGKVETMFLSGEKQGTKKTFDPATGVTTITDAEGNTTEKTCDKN